MFVVTFAGSPERLSLSLFAELENHQHLHLPEFPESAMGQFQISLILILCLDNDTVLSASRFLQCIPCSY